MALEMRPCTGMGGGGTADTTKNCIYDTATGQEQEITTMCSPGQTDGGCKNYGGDNYTFCTKDYSNPPPGTAWVQKCYTRNLQGQIYSISGSGGMPRQINNPNMVIGNPVTSADPQDIQYLQDSAPGSGAFKKMQTYVGGWWMNIFGLNQEPMPQGEEKTEEEVKEHKNKKALAIATTATVGVGAIYLIGKKMSASKLL